MNGIVISILSGIGFGVFQVLNRRAARQANAYLSTFVLLFVSAITLLVISLFSEDLSQLRNISPLAIGYFTLAACIHFVIGWTLLSISQKKVGAARTGVLLGTVPLWGVLIGALFFAEFFSSIIVVGIVLIVVGAYVVSADKSRLANTEIETGLGASLYGLGTAVCFAGSSIFIRYGLALFDSPLIGVTIGMTVATVIYAILLQLQPGATGFSLNLSDRNLQLQILAGFLVAVATWWRWLALDLTPIAVVISLSRLSTPTVLILSPIIIGQKFENVNRQVWLGAGIIIVGAMILTFS